MSHGYHRTNLPIVNKLLNILFFEFGFEVNSSLEGYVNYLAEYDTTQSNRFPQVKVNLVRIGESAYKFSVSRSMGSITRLKIKAYGQIAGVEDNKIKVVGTVDSSQVVLVLFFIYLLLAPLIVSPIIRNIENVLVVFFLLCIYFLLVTALILGLVDFEVREILAITKK